MESYHSRRYRTDPEYKERWKRYKREYMERLKQDPVRMERQRAKYREYWARRVNKANAFNDPHAESNGDVEADTDCT